MDKILSCAVTELKGNDRYIAMYARPCHGASIDLVRNDKSEFVDLSSSKT